MVDHRRSTEATPVEAHLRRGLAFRLAACEGRVRDRDGRSLWSTQCHDLGVELLGERLDDAGAKPGLGLGKDAVRPSNPVIDDGKFPVCPGNFIGDGDLSVFCSCFKSVL